MSAAYETRSGARTPRRRRVTSEILAPSLPKPEVVAALAAMTSADVLGMVCMVHDELVRRGISPPLPAPEAEPTVTPEQTLREAGIDGRRQAEYQRKMSTLLAGRHTAVASCP